MAAGTRAHSSLDSNTEDSRKARKRATDRRAQRDHRLRRKAYVEHLEKNFQTLRDQHTSDSRVEALLKEQQRLQQECARLATQLDHVRAIVIATTSSPANEDDNASGSEPHPGNANATVEEQCNRGDFDEFEYSDETGAQADCNASITEPIIVSSNGAHETFPVLDSSNPELMFPGFAFEPSDGIAPAQACFDVSNGALVQNTLELSFDMPLLVKPMSFPSDLAHLKPPNCIPPAGPSDRLLAGYIDEARVEHMNGRFDTSESTLRYILSDPPRDVLSFRLFHFITSYGPILLHLALATFWIQYLYLRWLVLGTRSAYEKVPMFMRPTALEYTVPHRFFIGMIAWVDIRHALIRDGSDVDPDAVGIDLLQSLDQKWSSPGFLGTSASIDVLSVIEKQAEDASFWRIGSSFFEKYPRYKILQPEMARTGSGIFTP